ncbi:MAG: hypothetical protein JRN68_04405 [Nitrososphaerota archaeon]|nr:hypothetical protein [Nitrososphaerota archaeon]
MKWALKERERERAPEFAERWLDFILGSREKAYLESPSEVSADVAWVYRESHLTPPKQIVIANSLVKYNEVIGRARGNHNTYPGDENVTKDIEAGIQARLYTKRTTDISRVIEEYDIKTINDLIKFRINRVLGSFANTISDARANISGMTAWTNQFRSGIGLVPDGGWLAESDFYDDACGIVIGDDLKRYQSFLKRGIYAITAFRNLTVILNAPREIHMNEDYRLHSISKPAISWRDGNKGYYLHGVRFPEDVWAAVKDRKMPARDVIGLRNIEQRTVALRIIGYDHVLEELGVKILDKKDTVNKWNGRKLHYELVEADLHDDRPWLKARFIKVQCPSTSKVTLLRVDPMGETATVNQAVAWTFGMKPEEYAPEVET